MEAVGLGLAVLAEVRTTLKSLQDRISCFKEKEALVAEADTALSWFKDLSDNITRVLTAKPKGIPKDFLSVFKTTLDNVKASLATANIKLGKVFSQVPSKKTSGSSRVARAGVKKVQQFAKAKSITKGLRNILAAANLADGTLQLLFTEICNAVKCDNFAFAFTPRMCEAKVNLSRLLRCYLVEQEVSKVRTSQPWIPIGSGKSQL